MQTAKCLKGSVIQWLYNYLRIFSSSSRKFSFMIDVVMIFSFLVMLSTKVDIFHLKLSKIKPKATFFCSSLSSNSSSKTNN
ncbi:hypothetical protein BpHYR1_030812 [Brachionus plicatilis]|uniref:Uncharacterized protein n=1 Tax=Brachionus plicatilis TaxID=10195 RepID=A0A3M7PAK3_BRAPC|nr:hypothetical protein BpHYR1_030812 [Brachionus plicatilis]